MKQRVWLIVLVLYAAAAVADGAYHLGAPPSPAARPNPAAAIPVAICAGLFWPIDMIARPLLLSS
jgi:hypothetical protein